MSIQGIAQAVHLPEAKVRAAVERMAEAGLLEPIGSGKGRAYILSAKAYRDKAGYVRQTDIERIRYPELVMKLMAAKGTITRNDVIELLHVTPSQAYRILQKLVKSGELQQEGTTKNTVYKKR